MPCSVAITPKPMWYPLKEPCSRSVIVMMAALHRCACKAPCYSCCPRIRDHQCWSRSQVTGYVRDTTPYVGSLLLLLSSRLGTPFPCERTAPLSTRNGFRSFWVTRKLMCREVMWEKSAKYRAFVNSLVEYPGYFGPEQPQPMLLHSNIKLGLGFEDHRQEKASCHVNPVMVVFLLLRNGAEISHHHSLKFFKMCCIIFDSHWATC